MRCTRASATHLLAGLVATVALAGCARKPPAPGVLETILARGEIRVATLNGPTSYYLGAHGPEGVEFTLAREFARELGVDLYIYPVADERALREELAAGRADLVAAQLSFDERWRACGLAVAPYDQVPQVFVYRRGRPRPKTLRAIERRRIVVDADSYQLQLLELLREAAPQLAWVETAGLLVEGPLAQVASGKADAALIDASEFAYLRPIYPRLGIALTLTHKRPVQWIVRRDGADLRARAEDFFERLRSAGELERLLHSAAGDSHGVRPDATRELPRHLETRLPPLRPLFEQAALETGIDWRLLAALGYQESQWDPRAQSSHGAQGVMMLMGATAASLGVSDPWDARANILAGARYLARMREKLPQRILEPDRTWLALAAYNVGFGHLEDARVITQKRGGNPDSWADVRTHLPLLAEERWYARVKRGYARGWEPVGFVDRIQQFLNVLEWRSANAATGVATTATTAPGAAGLDAQRLSAKNLESSAPLSSESTPPKTSTE